MNIKYILLMSFCFFYCNFKEKPENTQDGTLLENENLKISYLVFSDDRVCYSIFYKNNNENKATLLLASDSILSHAFYSNKYLVCEIVSNDIKKLKLINSYLIKKYPQFFEIKLLFNELKLVVKKNEQKYPLISIPLDSVVVDAILGQGEALDCYNMKLQDAVVSAVQLDNIKKQQAIYIIDGIENVNDKVDFYKKVFTNCCDVPQSRCGCNEPSNPV